MEAYKFMAIISEDGTIAIPEEFVIKNKVVEVIILDEIKEISETKKMTGKEFVNKYAGMFSGIDADKSKWEYLKEKHNL